MSGTKRVRRLKDRTELEQFFAATEPAYRAPMLGDTMALSTCVATLSRSL